MKYVWIFLLLSFLYLTLPAFAVDQCTATSKRCTCLFASEDDVEIENSGGAEDEPKTVGLAGATGALGGLLATGTALAVYFRFRGASISTGIPGGGGLECKEGRLPTPRPESAASSFYSDTSESPLIGKRTAESRFRPFTGVSQTPSNHTNIYRHPKVWPGRG